MGEQDEGQVCEIFPYFTWEIDDIDSLYTFSSHAFTVDGVDFTMLCSSSISSGQTSILLKPLVIDPKMILPPYNIKASISVVRPDKKREDLRFTQKTVSTNHNINDKGFHTIWRMEREDMLFFREKMVDARNGMNRVTFLCVFGQLSVYQKDDEMDDDAWTEDTSFVKLGIDINNLRLKADSTIVLKCGKDKIKANADILSVRSENFSSMILKNMVNGEVEISDMDFNVLDNIIHYLHSGLFRDDYLSDTLLTQAYKFASEYKIDQLQKMVCFKLLERMNRSYFFCSCSSVHKDVLSRSEQILSSARYTSDEYEKNAHVVEKEMFFVIPNFECLEEISNSFLELLLVVHKCKDKEFKESLIFSIVMKNSFILHTARFNIFFLTHSWLAMEIGDAYYKYNKRIQA